MHIDTQEIQHAVDARVPSHRGLICAYNARGQDFELTTLKKWARLSAQISKAEKADVRIRANNKAFFEELLRLETDPPLRYSARIAPAELDSAWLKDWHALGLWDLMLEIGAADWAKTKSVVHAAISLGIPVRAELLPNALKTDADVAQAVSALSGVKSVNISAYLPIDPARNSKPIPIGIGDFQRCISLAEKIIAQGTECNMLNFPFCTLPVTLWGHCINGQQYRKDHQQYVPANLDLAVKICGLTPPFGEKVLDIELGRQTSWHSQIDSLVLPWILRHPGAYVRVWMVHKLFRHLHLSKKRPKPLAESVTQVDAAIAKLREKQRRELGPICAQCRMREICDHAAETFKKVGATLPIRPIAGTVVDDPLAFVQDQPKYFDPLDETRRELPKRSIELAKEALRISTQLIPTREIHSDSYGSEGPHCHYMPGTVRWHSFSNVEILSTPLARVEPPFTIGVTFGGGIAKLIGFSFGRHAKIICPMLGHTHKLILHVDAEGQYVLLRDGVLMRPTEFLEHRLLPPRLSGVLEPCLTFWNIDGQICTQNILLWEQVEAEKREAGIKYSVLVVCTRYTRRLQAALLSLAHQKNVKPGELEIVVAYVPGIDPTDDLLDSMSLSFPDLRIVRSPFPKYHVRSKGLMINESVKTSSGDWIILLDSDIVLPPDFIQRLENESGNAAFCAPEGRKMLTPQSTAKILLGEVQPWDCYEELLAGEGNSRLHESKGVPPGFCQCVRRKVFAEIGYAEFEHFEGADWEFARKVMEEFGGVKRLEGMQVLHLDHQGSQWYGTDKQM